MPILPPRPTLVRHNAMSFETENILFPPALARIRRAGRLDQLFPASPPRLTQVPTPTDWECSICRDEDSVMSTVRHLCGAHIFHRECIERWMHRDRRCPMCRRQW
jgi:hypothetical protein